jgi:hypothetical protein
MRDIHFSAHVTGIVTPDPDIDDHPSQVQEQVEDVIREALLCAFANRIESISIAVSYEEGMTEDEQHPPRPH